MRFPLKGKLKKTLKIFGWIIGILFGILIIINIIGVIGDIKAQPELDRLRKKAEKYFEDYENQGGYLRPVYFEELEEGNAWDFYNSAVQDIKLMDERDKETLDSFAYRYEGVDTSHVISILSKYECILDEARQGLEKKKYFPTYEYTTFNQ